MMGKTKIENGESTIAILDPRIFAALRSLRLTNFFVFFV